MNILIQRGKDQFLVEKKGNYYLVNTINRQNTKIANPESVYRMGYCADPNPTKEQTRILEDILDDI